MLTLSDAVAIYSTFFTDYTHIHIFIYVHIPVFKPCDLNNAELFRNYLKQIREETSGRLLSVAYRPNGTPNKWWLAFAKRKFMNIIIP